MYVFSDYCLYWLLFYNKYNLFKRTLGYSFKVLGKNNFNVRFQKNSMI